MSNKTGFPRPTAKTPISHAVLACAAAVPSVALTAALLHRVQIIVAESEGHMPRPYSIGFVLLVAAFTAWGGLTTGLFTLLLAFGATLLFLLPNDQSGEVTRRGDAAELVLLLAVGVLIALAIDQIRRLGKRTNALLSESEVARARLRAVLDAAPLGVVSCDTSGKLDYANAEAERIWGQPLLSVTPEEWTRYNFLDEDGKPIKPENMGLARALRGEQNIVGQSIIERPDTSRVWITANTTQIRESDNTLIGAVSAFQDITQRKTTEDALRDSEENYRFLAETVPQIVWTTRPDGYHDYFNRRWFEYTGWDSSDGRGWDWSTVLHPDDQARSIAVWNHCLATGESYNIEYRLRRASDGTYRWFLGQALPLRDENGQITRWFGTCTDIHDQKAVQLERELLAERESLLNRIGQAQRVSDDPQRVAALAVEELARVLHTDRAYLTFYDNPRGYARIVAESLKSGLTPLAGEYRLRDFPIDFAALFAEKVSVTTPDVRTSPAFAAAAPVLEPLGLRSHISVPLFDEGRLTAILAVAMATEARDWTADDVTTIEAVAAQTRITMNLAELRQREHNIAERLQDALKPSLPEGVPGLKLAQYYRPALAEASIGGDFFDVFHVEKGCIALVVGDLSGKGLAAASQIATVRNMLRFALYRGRTISSALMELNETLSEHGLLTGFATLFVGLYDTGAQTLTYVSCGHEPGLVRRASGIIDQLSPTGPVLGAFTGVQYEQCAVPLGTGDALLVFTDGLSEAGRSRRDFLGVEGIARAVEAFRSEERVPDADALMQNVIKRVNEHTRGIPHDDQCLLVAVAVRP